MGDRSSISLPAPTPMNSTLCCQRRLLLEKNILLDDISTSSATRSGAKQSRWPSLLSLFNISATTKLGHQAHRTPPSGRLSASRQFQSEVNVSTATDRKQYGRPEVAVGRLSSTLSRPAFVSVDIPLPEDSVPPGSTTSVVEKGIDPCRKCSTVLI